MGTSSEFSYKVLVHGLFIDLCGLWIRERAARLNEQATTTELVDITHRSRKLKHMIILLSFVSFAFPFFFFRKGESYDCGPYFKICPCAMRHVIGS